MSIKSPGEIGLGAPIGLAEKGYDPHYGAPPPQARDPAPGPGPPRHAHPRRRLPQRLQGPNQRPPLRRIPRIPPHPLTETAGGRSLRTSVVSVGTWSHLPIRLPQLGKRRGAKWVGRRPRVRRSQRKSGRNVSDFPSYATRRAKGCASSDTSNEATVRRLLPFAARPGQRIRRGCRIPVRRVVGRR
jgi:hypothetical protein